jgi:hypothetical protein
MSFTKIYENRVLRSIIGLERVEVTNRRLENTAYVVLIICTVDQILLGLSNQGDRDGLRTEHAREN